MKWLAALWAAVQPAIGLARDVLWLVIRRKKQEDDPANKYAKARSANAKAVTSGDSDAVNARLDANLDRLRHDAGRSD